MGEAIELRLDRLDHPGMAMSGVDHGNAGDKVDVAVSLDIPDLRIFRAFGVDLRHHADASRDGICLAALNGSVLTHFSNFLRYLHVRLVKRGQMRTRPDQFGQIVCL
jgi:hypothetical protein